jgi:RimJ/RimL family protein N-acetyltransferase
VRFDITQGQAEISVSIDKNERGKGYGPAVIKRGSDYLMATEPVHRIVAQMKRDNPASMIAFERAGFALGGFRQIEGVEAYEMIYEGRVNARTQSGGPRSLD